MKIEYILIKSLSDNNTQGICTSPDSLKYFLQANTKLSITDNKIIVDNFNADYSLISQKTEQNKEVTFLIKISSDDENEDTQVECLEIITRQIRKSLKINGLNFRLNTVWDDVSHYYCSKSYPKINKVENLMRKLISQFMIKKIGSNWVEQVFPEELIKQFAKKGTSNNPIEDHLYEADFIHLSTFLFQPYSKINSIDSLFELISSIKPKGDMKQQLENIINLKPKSNWERYFKSIDTLKGISTEGLENDWKKLYDLRNKVAHNKLFTKKDYAELTRLATKLEKLINDAIEKIDDISIPDDQKKLVAQSAAAVSIEPMNQKKSDFNQVESKRLEGFCENSWREQKIKIAKIMQDYMNKSNYNHIMEEYMESLNVFRDLEESIKNIDTNRIFKDHIANFKLVQDFVNNESSNANEDVDYKKTEQDEDEDED